MNESAALETILISDNVQDMLTIMFECTTPKVVKCIKDQLTLHGIVVHDPATFRRLASTLNRSKISMDDKLGLIALITDKMPTKEKLHCVFALIRTFDSVELIAFIANELRQNAHDVESLDEFRELVGHLLVSTTPIEQRMHLARLLARDLNDPTKRTVALFELLRATCSIDLVNGIVQDLQSQWCVANTAASTERKTGSIRRKYYDESH